MKTRNFKKWTVIAAIIICMAFMLMNGCGKKKGVSDKQLRKDIAERVTEISDYGLKVDKVKKERRLTSVKDRYDQVWVDVTASNKYCDFTGQYQLYYTLYDNGWYLDVATPIVSELTPKIAAEDFSQSIPDKAVEEMGYSNYWLEDRNDGSRNISFRYGAYEPDGTEMSVYITYEFSPDRGWYQFTSSALSANAYGW